MKRVHLTSFTGCDINRLAVVSCVVCSCSYLDLVFSKDPKSREICHPSRTSRTSTTSRFEDFHFFFTSPGIILECSIRHHKMTELEPAFQAYNIPCYANRRAAGGMTTNVCRNNRGSWNQTKQRKSTVRLRRNRKFRRNSSTRKSAGRSQ